MKKNQERREKRVKVRRDREFHRGGEKAQRQPGIEVYVHTRRKGKVRRDRDQSVEQRVIVLNRIEKRRKENREIVVVGTTPELGRRIVMIEKWNKAGEGENRKKRKYITRGWVSGLLTNYEKNPGKQSKRKGIPVRKEFPGLIVFRNPNDHGVGRKEARRSGIPTTGIADSDCKYVDRRTYPIPGNDDSRSGQRRVRRRLRKRCNK